MNKTFKPKPEHLTRIRRVTTGRKLWRDRVVALFEPPEAKGAKTSNVNLCNNRGCGFNQDLYCSATGTECFGYIEVST